MNIILISGSHRPTGNSGRIAAFIAGQLKGQGHNAEVLDLATTELPFWDEAFWGEKSLQPKWDKLWQPWAEKLMAADAAILVSPEYHGMVPAKLKNFLLLAGESGKPLAHKPVMLVSVSKSINGAYPIAELRATGGKNTRMVFIPEHIIVRNADGMLTDAPKPQNDPSHAKFDAELRQRLTDTLEILEEYAVAMKPLQETARNFLKKYPNGM